MISEGTRPRTAQITRVRGSLAGAVAVIDGIQHRIKSISPICGHSACYADPGCLNRRRPRPQGEIKVPYPTGQITLHPLIPIVGMALMVVASICDRRAPSGDVMASRVPAQGTAALWSNGDRDERSVVRRVRGPVLDTLVLPTVGILAVWIDCVVRIARRRSDPLMPL
jgi:hypothetical protein